MQNLINKLQYKLVFVEYLLIEVIFVSLAKLQIFNAILLHESFGSDVDPDL